MGGQPPGVDFALIGHAESWDQVLGMMNALRDPELAPHDNESIRDVYPWIPPRTVERIVAASAPSGDEVAGIYVDAFIAPDRLGRRHVRANLERVLGAIDCAHREGAPIAALGGFNSIVLQAEEGKLELPPGLALTTGNSLTAAFIVRGVETAAGRVGVSLEQSALLVIGSTGDLGRACTNYMVGRVRHLLLCARDARGLERQRTGLVERGIGVTASTSASELLPEADVVISVASLGGPSFDIDACKSDVLVCDAGYPKNMVVTGEGSDRSIFWGGMGRALGGWRSSRGLATSAYSFPGGDVAHGCLLEAVVLAMEGRYEAYSQGRGNITGEKMEEIFELAAKHGIVPAPLFHAGGLWPDLETE